MILPDDVDEKVEFWVGETDSEGDEYSDSETVVSLPYSHPPPTRRPQKRTRLLYPPGKARSESGVGASGVGVSNTTTAGAGSSSRKRKRVLGNGLLAVPAAHIHTRDRAAKNTFAVDLEKLRGVALPLPPLFRGEWKSDRMGLPDMGSEPTPVTSYPPSAPTPPIHPPHTHSTRSENPSAGQRHWGTMRRPPGLGIDLWPNYVSPRTPQRVDSTSTTSSVATTTSPASPVRGGSIDESEGEQRRSSRTLPTSLFGAVWNWAWHWR